MLSPIHVVSIILNVSLINRRPFSSIYGNYTTIELFVWSVFAMIYLIININKEPKNTNFYIAEQLTNKCLQLAINGINADGIVLSFDE